jgi:hypothetical protein
VSSHVRLWGTVNFALFIATLALLYTAWRPPSFSAGSTPRCRKTPSVPEHAAP